VLAHAAAFDEYHDADNGRGVGASLQSVWPAFAVGCPNGSAHVGRSGRPLPIEPDTWR